MKKALDLIAEERVTVGASAATGAAHVSAHDVLIDGADVVVGSNTAAGTTTLQGHRISMGADISNVQVATLAAAGSNLATAAQIVAPFTIVTGADDAKGVKLPAAVVDGDTYEVVVETASKTVIVYPGAAADLFLGVAAAGVGLVVGAVIYKFVARISAAEGNPVTWICSASGAPSVVGA